jgi:GNAT superfamily N-acetyltransferase
VAHASIHPDGRGAAEAAFAVADELQGQGVGSRLMAATVALALRVGVHRLSANLYVDNLPMRRLLVDAGRALVSDTLEAGTEEITLDLDRAA